MSAAEEPVPIELPGAPVAVKAFDAPPGSGAPSEPPGGPADPLEGQRRKLQEMQQRVESRERDLARIRQALEGGLGQLQELKWQVFHEAREQLIDLAIDIARKVLMQEIQAERYDIDPIVAEALARVPARCDVVVHLNPEDWSRCQTAGHDPEAGEARQVRFVSDWSVPRAQCVLETSEGVVTSDVEGHLGRIGEALKEPANPPEEAKGPGGDGRD